MPLYLGGGLAAAIVMGQRGVCAEDGSSWSIGRLVDNNQMRYDGDVVKG
ncbi:MAG: hypothetical protein JW918_20050 [Anaerolineae bacterium]|nr:hypothetical protein [Anaerolineae bacterium]